MSEFVDGLRGNRQKLALVRSRVAEIARLIREATTTTMYTEVIDKLELALKHLEDADMFMASALASIDEAIEALKSG